jgi:hypothetical protein
MCPLFPWQHVISYLFWFQIVYNGWVIGPKKIILIFTNVPKDQKIAKFSLIFSKVPCCKISLWKAQNKNRIFNLHKISRWIERWISLFPFFHAEKTSQIGHENWRKNLGKTRFSTTSLRKKIFDSFRMKVTKCKNAFHGRLVLWHLSNIFK